ncbi:hypothetical protein TNCV_454631 [Trichonephila clavipes]|nr:hypothetical protein TNCV_454631 [Trichonephila clavipes]
MKCTSLLRIADDIDGQSLSPELNSVAQQPMKAKAYCVHLSIRDHWALRCMSRCPDQSEAKPPVFSPQAIVDSLKE